MAADNVPAIIHIANSGQEIGTALADVLFGDYNPGGRTTMTWYASETDIPTTIFDYDIKKGTTYWYFKGTPVFPFGHGLSYTTFKYENLAMSGTSVSTNTSVNVSVDVTNTGTRAGDEVVQLYVAYPQSTTLPRPRTAASRLQAGHAHAGTEADGDVVAAGKRAHLLGHDGEGVRCPAGTVQIQVGSTSKDIRLMGNLNVTP